jgi:probable rRNA maturation factor
MKTISKPACQVTLVLQNVPGQKNLPPKKLLTQWLQLAIRDEREQAEITLRIVDPAEITRLNAVYRGKDYATNVLSFPFESRPGLHLPILGDLVICASVVEQEAKQQGKTLTAHWAHLVIHGCLHLLGYDHIVEAEAKTMETIEIELLNMLNFPNPYDVE